MRRTTTGGFTILAGLLFGIVGCSDTSGVHEETKISTPEGTKTITHDTKVETTGSNPPTTVQPEAPRP
jgi:hypothetical protein